MPFNELDVNQPHAYLHPHHGMKDEVRRRLEHVRGGVRDKMDEVERSLIDDIEIAGVAARMRAPPVSEMGETPHDAYQHNRHSPHHSNHRHRHRRPHPSVPRSLDGVGVGGDACELCGLDRTAAAFCAMTGKMHASPLTQFEATRKALLRGEETGRPAATIATQTQAALPGESGADAGVLPGFLLPADAAASPWAGRWVDGERHGRLELGGYCVARRESEVRRACNSGAVAWQEGMAEYCGARKVGRVTFAKKFCGAADVAFPDGTSWLFPVTALVPYTVPDSLDTLERYPLPDAPLDDDATSPHARVHPYDHENGGRNDPFLHGLQRKIAERHLVNRASELQMRYIEMYIEIYKEEKLSRARLAATLKDISEIHQLEGLGGRRRGFAGGYGSPASRRRPASPPADVLRIQPISPQGPLPVVTPAVQGEVLRRAPADHHLPTNDAWRVVGLTQGGHYVFDDVAFNEPSDAEKVEAASVQRQHAQPPHDAGVSSGDVFEDEGFVPYSLHRRFQGPGFVPGSRRRPGSVRPTASIPPYVAKKEAFL